MTVQNVRGLAELGEALKGFTAGMQKKGLRVSIRAGGRVGQGAVKGRAPRRSGVLQGGVQVGVKQRGANVVAIVATTGKHRQAAYWLEFGVAAHKIIPKKAKALFFGLLREHVDHPGFKPKPFVRPAMDGAAQAVLVATGEALRAWLRRQGTRVGKKGDVGYVD